MEEDLRKLLEEWSTPHEYVEKLEAQMICTLHTLALMDKSAVAALFDKLGARLEFEEKLFEWQAQRKCLLTADELTRVASEAAEHSKETVEGAASTVLAEMLQDGSVIVTPSAEIEEAAKQPPQTEAVQRSPPESAAQKRASARPSLFDLDLARLCGSCLNGKCVMRYYKQHSDLDDANRNLLADVILNDYLKDEAHKKLPSDVEEAMAGCVLSLFPTEKKEVWVSANCRQRSSSAGRGKLLSRYYDIRRKLNKSGLLQKSPCSDSADLSHSDDEDENGDSELGDHLLWLQNNKQPWSKVSSLWELTSKHRMRQLVSRKLPVHTYLTKYPALQDPSGYLLLSTDFDLKYPASGMSLFMEWPQLMAFIVSKVPKPEDITESLTEDGKKIRVIQALPYLFAVITCAKKGKKQWRPSRQEVAEALLLHVKCIGDINISLASRARDKYEPYNLSLGPQAVVVGPTLDDISHSFVRINSTMYEVENPLKALDITFKTMHALDCKYHKESEREWLFLERAVYHLNSDKPDGKLSAILKSYSDFKKNN
ncbi:hypothetical protein FOCC_FOCC006579 [Frankliniella occidentalis]|nr:hypothetical protein FOCC_FOCC006579 [Frankliniella occidentalis]